MRRTITAELLDSDSGTPAEVQASLADLSRINRWFGGITTLCAMVEQVSRQTGQASLNLLDVGAGTGELAMRAAQRLARRNIELRAVALDRAVTHLASGGKNCPPAL